MLSSGLSSTLVSSRCAILLFKLLIEFFIFFFYIFISFYIYSIFQLWDVHLAVFIGSDLFVSFVVLSFI